MPLQIDALPEGDQQDYGECRRHAPQINVNLPLKTRKAGKPMDTVYLEHAGGWRKTHRMDWCGEFQERRVAK